MSERRWGNFSSCCRLCLSEKLGTLKSIFEDASRSREIVKNIRNSLGMDIQANDKLSTMICEQCLSKVNSWNDYRKFCSENQTKLLGWMNTWTSSNIADISIQIKDEVVEDSEEQPPAPVIVDDDDVIQVKSEPAENAFESEPMEDDIYDMPPPLTPHPPDEHVHSFMNGSDDEAEDEPNHSKANTSAPYLGENLEVNGMDSQNFKNEAESFGEDLDEEELFPPAKNIWEDKYELSDSENSEQDENSGEDLDEETPFPPNKKKKEDRFCWKTKVPALKSKFHPFTKTEVGCLDPNVGDNVSILECFEVFISKDFIASIVNQTNLYRNQSVKVNVTPAHQKKWTAVDIDEMYVFVALSILMAQVKKLKIHDYWTTDLVLYTPFFGQVMSRDRYLSILSSLHFADNENLDKNDSLCKIRLLVKHIRNTYRSTFYPFQNLCIDKSLMLFNGHRFGTKLYVLCDCETGYILDFIIYCGTISDIKEIEKEVGKSGNIVLTMMQSYLDSGHTLYTDSWCTSPLLYNHLHSRKTNACGMVKQSRKYMPDMKRRINCGETIWFSTDNLLAIKWQDKREVRMLTSCHKPEMVDTGKIDRHTGENKIKPRCIVDYNANMGAVDRTDMLQSSIESVRTTIKWYKKIFFYLMDMTLLNAHALYQMKTGIHIPVADYQLQLIKDLIAKYHKNKPRGNSKSGTTADSPLRLTARHFPTKLPKNADTNKQQCRRCIVCSKLKIRKETSYICAPCEVPLCVLGCFARYHTVENY